ncbi:MAG: alanine--tRNA ligase [archaeon]|nr:alanine--tRNA ligase [archaeon]
MDKAMLREQFTKDWKKHYDLEFLKKKGFQRKQCVSCKRFFWTIDQGRQKCADASCIGYEFIGKGTTKLDYVEAWQEIEKYFKKTGHTSIKRFPTIARWRDDLFFTNASIIDFQPYVVNGITEPPANPLIVPQACIRFGDITNVGVTGAHYTSFIMFGQHAFNSKKTGTFYWKNEAIEHDYNYIRKIIGVNEKDLCFHEEVWAGGGAFGPSMEYVANGLELGNCVFMQYKELENGKSEELPIKVIDMGAGLERLAWFSNGTPTSYDVTFNYILPKLKKDLGIQIDKELFERFSKMAGMLNADEVKDLKHQKHEIAKKLNISEEDLFNQLEKLQALYAILDHTKTILYAFTDGMLPSNSGGGYNLRMILRRAFAFNKEFDFNLDFYKIVQEHAKNLEEFDDSLMSSMDTIGSLLKEEQAKYENSVENGRKKLITVIDKAKRERVEIGEKELIKLYESDGITIETVKEISVKHGLKMNIPENFYSMITKENEKIKEKKKMLELEGIIATKQLYYETPYESKFIAKVLKVIGDFVILDQTMFYPEGGGQVFDQGTLNGIEVINVQKQNNVIVHELKDSKKFKPGLKVEGNLDWRRRHNLMRHHTATHLLNASCRELLGNHIWQAGALKEADKAHLDITHFKRLTTEEIKKIELIVNKRIQENLEVETEILERGKAEQKFGFRIYQGGFVPGKILRLVKVKGLDVQACGGTHIARTGEIGAFKILKRENVRDGVERITFSVGLSAIEFTQTNEDKLRQTAEILGIQEQKIGESALKFLNEWKEQKKTIEELRKQIIDLSIQSLISSKNEIISEFIEGLDDKAIVELAQKALEEKMEKTFIIVSNGNVLIMCGEKSRQKANELLQKILKQVKGNGGGNEKIARGKVEDLEKLKEVLKRL